MRKMWIPVTFSALLVSAIATGCGGSANNGSGAGASPSNSATASATPPKLSNDPVTIRYLCSTTPSVCVDLMNKAKEIANLPNVTIEADIATNIDKNVAAGWTPDIVNVTTSFFYKVIDAGYVQDMTPLIKRNNYDLSVFQPAQLDAIRKYDPAGGLYALPDKVNLPYNGYGLVYNKDIFDKFAIPYPKDNMTWDEVIELSKKLSRTDGGTTYTGLVIDQPNELVIQEGLNYSDNNGNVNLSDPKWKTIMELLKTGYDVNKYQTYTTLDTFYKNKNIAMYAGNMILILRNAATFSNDLNWDVATFPRFNDMKQTVLPPAAGLFAVTKQSKNQDIALALLKAMQSPEMQQDTRAPYESDAVKNKHMAAVTNQQMANYLPEKYNQVSEPIFRKKLTEMYTKDLDVNTAISQMQEEIKAAISQQAGK